jgi:plasmid stabilization system protein ParE
MGWRVALTDEADRDLESVVAFLAQVNPAAAERIGLELVNLILARPIAPSGRGGEGATGTTQAGPPALSIIHRVNPVAALVEIVRIWDNRQDPAKLLLP